jgi:hypothetical protein
MEYSFSVPRSPFSVVNRGERLPDVKLVDSVRVRRKNTYE